MKKQSGFTLIELAIVLVIIGLLLGGVLKGQELITQAKIKNVSNDFNGITAALYSYRDRYAALPGDDKGTARWGLTPPSTAGNGKIDGKYNSPTASDESRLFWQHLRLAGFTAGATTDTQQPSNAVGGIVGVQDGGEGLTGTVICSSNLPGKVANAIDSQMDDGAPNTGSIRGHKQAASNEDAGSTSTSDATYVDDGSSIYVICKNL